MEPDRCNTSRQRSDSRPPDHQPVARRKSEPAQNSKDVYQLVTDRVIEALEQGTTIPWKKPWAALGGVPRNLASRRPYRGLNVILLSLGQPYQSPWWLTYRQAQGLGGQVRRGERASIVTFWKFDPAPTDPSPGDGGEDQAERCDRRAPILRYYHVFNLEQCDGIPHPPSDEFQPRSHTPLAVCERIVSGMPQRPAIQPDPRQACYLPALDYVGMPDRSQFETAEAYYATLFHELVHSTGHPSRLARPFLGTPAPFGCPDYSKEELVAEFGAAFLCGHTGIFPRVADNSAAYIQGWLSVLKGDKKLLPLAAAQAQRAADFILGEHAGDEAPQPATQRITE